MKNPLALPILLAASLSACGSAADPKPAQPAASSTDIVRTALTDPLRVDQAKNDARRHAQEIVTFTGVKPGDKVLDLIPGAGYWTRIFARVAGPSGHVYSIWPKPYAAEAKGDVEAVTALTRTPGYANVTATVQPTTALTAPEKLDLVFTSQNYHDYPDKFMGGVDPMVLNRAVFGMLKSGGSFVVIDHVADAGSGMRDTDTLHRIDPAAVKAQVIAAGFEFVGESNALRNPADDHKLAVFDKSIRGHTDQFTYRFRKP